MYSPDHPEDGHHIFRALTKWNRTATFADAVTDRENERHLSPKNVIMLVRRIMVAHLDFQLMRSGCPNLRLENYVHYERDVQAEDMENEGVLLLRPSLACGFGRRHPDRQPGATSGPSKDPNAAVLELGLVLFQIGRRQTLNYQTKALGGTVETLRDVTNEALGGLWKVEKVYGPVFARVIEVCPLSGAGNEMENIGNGLTKLIKLQNVMRAPVHGRSLELG